MCNKRTGHTVTLLAQPQQVPLFKSLISEVEFQWLGPLSSPASCTSLRPAACLVDPLEDCPILHLASHRLSDRMRTPVSEGMKRANGGQGRAKRESLILDTEENYTFRVNYSRKKNCTSVFYRRQFVKQSHSNFGSFPPYPPSFCFETFLWCLHAFNRPQDLQECFVGSVYSVVPPLSIHICLHSVQRR